MRHNATQRNATQPAAWPTYLYAYWCISHHPARQYFPCLMTKSTANMLGSSFRAKHGARLRHPTPSLSQLERRRCILYPE